MLICRTEQSISREDREKIALFCNISIDAVIEEKDKDFSIYEVPLSLVDNKLDELICRQARPEDAASRDLDDWRELLRRLRNPEHEISIAVVGKYAEHRDAYKSIYESLDHAGIAHSRPGPHRPHSKRGDRSAKGPSGCSPATTASSCPAASASAASKARSRRSATPATKGIPFFGICLGMQCAVIEFARNVCNLAGAHSTEFDKDTPHPVICLLDEQKTITDKGGTMRLGAQPAKLEPGSIAATCYGKTEISERHRHRYEFNNVYRQQFTAHGMRFSGTSPDGSLVEIIELPEHPWFLAVQFHPEFKSKPTAPQPLFAGFIGAAVEHNKARGERDGGEEAGDARSSRPRPRISLHSWRSHGRRQEDHHRRGLEVAGRGREGSRLRKRSLLRPRAADERRFVRGDRSADAAGVVRDAAHDARDRSARWRWARCRIRSPARREVQRNQAKFLIDTVDVLRQKTEGQSDAAEQQVIDSLLHQMRMVFIADADGRAVADSTASNLRSAAEKSHTQREHRWQPMPASPLIGHLHSHPLDEAEISRHACLRWVWMLRLDILRMRCCACVVNRLPSYCAAARRTRASNFPLSGAIFLELRF